MRLPHETPLGTVTAGLVLTVALVILVRLLG